MHRISRRIFPIAVAGSLLLTLLFSAPARAANVTDLASAFDEGDPFDFNFRIGYSRTLSRGLIQRELVGRDITQAGVELVKDLRFSEVTHTLSLRAEVGIWRDLQLHVELPIILSNSRTLSFAQNDGDSCGTPPTTNCVTPQNSTLVRDGLLDGSLMSADQITVAGPNGAPGGRLFPDRSGIDQIYLGISWAPVNQRRDPTKPTWVIGFEARVAAGSPMEYDPSNPTANTSVGRGINQFHWWTDIARSFPYVDAWMGFHYMLPVATSDSLFNKTTFPGSGQERSDPRQIGWIEAGMEIIPWEKPKDNTKVTIELRGRVEGLFEGRGYSPIWELLANQDNLAGPCLADPTGGQLTWNNGTYCQTDSQLIPYPGITRIENHLNFFGTFAVNVALTKHFKGRLGVSLGHEQDHSITFADAGHAVCDPNNPGSGCQGKLDPNDPHQVNPMYRPLIDSTGRRFHVAESTVFDFFVSLMALF